MNEHESKKVKATKKREVQKNVGVGSKNKKSVQEKSIESWKVLAIAVGIGVAYYSYISTLFENDLFFSRLSTLERELAFRTEMGLYYSYYKAVVEAPTLSQGISSLLKDNRTEYPSTINTLERFNLYPEVVLGLLFRGLRIGLKRDCFEITRGYKQPKVESCVGLGDIHNFYVTCIFALNGMLGGLIFYLGWSLSGSLWGGALSMSQFLYNHSESTRIMWTPPLRESFSFPFFFLQLLVVIKSLRTSSFTWRHGLSLTMSTVGFMIPWQFAQFALFTQLLSLLGTYLLGYLSYKRFQGIMICLLSALSINYVLQFFNPMLFSSLLFPCLIICLAMTSLHRHFQRINNNIFRWCIQVTLVGISTLTLKLIISKLSGIQDDNHIFNILRSKFTDYKDFDTQLYTCAAEFDFIGWAYIGNVCATFLMPAWVFVLLHLAREYLRNFYWRGQAENSIAEQENGSKYYMAFQTLAFSVLALLIMRLKLFFTPSMCLLVSLLPVSTYGRSISQKKLTRLLIGYLAISSVLGCYNVYKQMQVFGEYNNPMMEELVLWIRGNTHENAVFAGSMSTMANIKLSTGRPIANHPHYENLDIRERTRKIYQIFARVDPSRVHTTLKGLGIQYVVVEDGFCNKETRSGCKLADALALENEDFEEETAFCELVGYTTPPGFRDVFKNKNHRVLRLI